MSNPLTVVQGLAPPKPLKGARFGGTDPYDEFRGTNPYEEEAANHAGQHVWDLAGAMAADRAQTESGRLLKTYLYASALFAVAAAVLVLVMIGASLLFVVGTAEIVCSRVARSVSRRLRAEPGSPRRGFGIRHWLRLLALQSAARLR